MTKIALTRFTGFAETHDRFRPVPQNSIALPIFDFFGKEEVNTFVDLGCGTELSTYIKDILDEDNHGISWNKKQTLI